MNTTTVMDRVRAYVSENFLYMRPTFQLGDDDRLLGRGVIDSIGVMELIEFLGDEFRIEIVETEITEKNLGTLRSIARYVESKRVGGEAVSYHGIGSD
jgi:acyl carrier protein